MDTFVAYAPLIGLTFFFGVFLMIVVSVLRPGAKQKLQLLAEIPLKEENHDRAE